MGLPDISVICSRSMQRARKRTFRTEVLKSSLVRIFSSTTHLSVLVLFLLKCVSMADGERLYLDSLGVVVGQPDCGRFLQADETSGVITSPEIGENGAVCKWIIEAPERHPIKNLKNTFEYYQTNLKYSLDPRNHSDGACQIVEIREPGCEDEIVDSLDCESSLSKEITSRGRWFCVTFASYNSSSAGAFQATYVSVTDKNRTKDDFIEYDRNPTECAYYEFACANKVCVSYGYRCDLVNDCGCFSENCDETGCFFSRTFATSLTIGIGFSVGFAMMIAVMVSGLCIEKRHNWYHLQTQVSRDQAVRKRSNRKDGLNAPAVNVNANCNIDMHTHSSMLHTSLPEEGFHLGTS